MLLLAGKYLDKELFWITIGSLMTLQTWAMGFICLGSFKHIHQNQKSLESLGIYPNTQSMKLYTTFWLGIALSYTFVLTLRLLKLFLTEPEKILDYQLDTAIQIVYIFVTLFVCSLDSLILLTYLKFSKKLEAEKAEKIQSSL